MSAPRARSGALAILSIALLVQAGDARPRDDHPWYAPDHAKLQLAGNIGFLSPGVGYSLARRLDADLFLGWVPAAIGGEDLLSVTGKLSWAPWAVALPRRWLVRPVALALQLTYHFGEEYWLFLPERFPDEYYSVPTALRAGVAFGSEASHAVWGREVGFYYELVALDAGLYLWLTNRRALGPWDVFSLALGVRVAF